MSFKIPSTDIKVYPTAYRGENINIVEGTPQKKLYNPGSRLFTEENIAKPYINLINYTKDKTKTPGSFVISKKKTDNPFKFVICGYYFELKNSPTNFEDNTKTYYAKINIQNIGTEDPNNTNLYTNYLLPINNTQITTLDSFDDANKNDYFNGLEILDELPSGITSDPCTYLMLVDKGIVPDTSLIKYSQYTLEGGEDKPLSKFLRTDDIKINKTLIDNKEQHDTEFNFEDSSEKIKRINATEYVTTPRVFTQGIQNTESSYFHLNSAGEIIIETHENNKTNIKLQTWTPESDIDLNAKDSVHITALGAGNTTGAYITLQAGENATESYILPSISVNEPEDFNQSHTLATREWINASFNTEGTQNDVVQFKIANQTYNHTVNNVKHADHSSRSDKIKLNSTSSDTNYYMLLSNEAVGDANNVYKSSVVYIDNSGTLNGTNINFSGMIKGQTFNATSDFRLKENIKLYTPKKSILDLRTYEFNFKGKEEKHIGCIAQELQTLFPELVHEGEDGYLSIEENKLVYLLLEEVKKLRKDVDQLKK